MNSLFELRGGKLLRHQNLQVLNAFPLPQSVQDLTSLSLVGLPNVDLALASTILNIGDSVLVAVRVGDLDRDLAIRKLSCCGSE